MSLRRYEGGFYAGSRHRPMDIDSQRPFIDMVGILEVPRTRNWKNVRLVGDSMGVALRHSRDLASEK